MLKYNLLIKLQYKVIRNCYFYCNSLFIVKFNKHFLKSESYVFLKRTDIPVICIETSIFKLLKCPVPHLHLSNSASYSRVRPAPIRVGSLRGMALLLSYCLACHFLNVLMEFYKKYEEAYILWMFHLIKELCTDVQKQSNGTRRNSWISAEVEHQYKQANQY